MLTFCESGTNLNEAYLHSRGRHIKMTDLYILYICIAQPCCFFVLFFTDVLA